MFDRFDFIANSTEEEIKKLEEKDQMAHRLVNVELALTGIIKKMTRIEKSLSLG